MAIRLQCTAYTEANKRYDIIIHDAEYAGSIIDFTVDDKGYVISYDTVSEELHTGIVATRCECIMLMDSADHETFVTDLNSAYEDQFIMVVKYENVTKWFGRILPDLVTIEDLPLAQLPSFKIVAVDNLKALESIDYKNVGGPWFGQDNIVSHLIKCIDAIGLGSYAAFSWVLECTVNWFAAEQAAGDPAFQIYTDHRAFYQVDDAGEIVYPSIYNVLEQMCTTYHAKFWLHDGAYKFTQHNEAISTSVNVYRYTAAGTLWSNSIVNNEHPVTKHFVGKLGGGNYNFFKALNEVEVHYVHYGYSNIAQGYSWNQTTQPTIPVSPTVFNVKEDDVLSFSANFSYYVRTNNVVPRFIKLAFTIQVGSGYINRPVEIIGGVTSTGSQVINSTSSNRFELVVYLTNLSTTTTFTEAESVAKIEFSTMKFPSAGDLQFKIEMEGVYDTYDTKLTTEITDLNWAASNVKCNTFEDGNPENFKNTRITRIPNTTAGNSQKDKLVVGFGQSIGFGRVTVNDGIGGKPEGTSWGVGATDAGVTFEELLAREYIKSRLVPVKKFSARFEKYDVTYSGPYKANKTIVHEGNKWVFWKGKYIAHKELFEGEWYLAEVGVSTGTKVETGAVTDKYDGAVLTHVPLGEGKNPGINKEPLEIDKGPGLIAVIFPNINETIQVGATVTSIDVPTRTVDGEYKQGQNITLINPDTGISQVFEVSADSQIGDTSIGIISEVSTGYFPDGSLIIVKQEEQAIIIDKRYTERNVGLGDTYGNVVITHGLNTQDIVLYLEEELTGYPGYCQISAKTDNTITLASSGYDIAYKVIITA